MVAAPVKPFSAGIVNLKNPVVPVTCEKGCPALSAVLGAEHCVVFLCAPFAHGCKIHQLCVVRVDFKVAPAVAAVVGSNIAPFPVFGVVGHNRSAGNVVGTRLFIHYKIYKPVFNIDMAGKILVLGLSFYFRPAFPAVLAHIYRLVARAHVYCFAGLSRLGGCGVEGNSCYTEAVAVLPVGNAKGGEGFNLCKALSVVVAYPESRCS